jgi:hypothetical protein
MADVVTLPRSRPIVTLVDSPATIRLVQTELLTSGRTYKEVAHAAQLATSTVSNIASGATRWPRLETTIRLLGALGWMITAQKR